MYIYNTFIRQLRLFNVQPNSNPPNHTHTYIQTYIYTGICMYLKALYIAVHRFTRFTLSPRVAGATYLFFVIIVKAVDSIALLQLRSRQPTTDHHRIGYHHRLLLCWLSLKLSSLISHLSTSHTYAHRQTHAAIHPHIYTHSSRFMSPTCASPITACLHADMKS